MDTTSIEQRLNTANELIEHVGRKIVEYRMAEPLITQEKGDSGTDFTTKADLMSERIITEGLKRAFPDDEILSEESAPSSYSDYQGKKSLWIIDPLDGTNNYTLGEDTFGISIGFWHEGKMEIGVINMPMRRRIYYATRSSKTRVYDTRRTGTENRVIPPTVKPQEATIHTSFSYSMADKQKTLALLQKLTYGNFRAFVAHGSCVEGITALLDHRVHAYVEPATKPWDAAAGCFLVEMADGVVSGHDGTPWHPFRPDFVAARKSLHRDIIDLLGEGR